MSSVKVRMNGGWTVVVKSGTEDSHLESVWRLGDGWCGEFGLGRAVPIANQLSSARSVNPPHNKVEAKVAGFRGNH